MENCARQPLSTQIPRWLTPHDLPRTHSLSLSVRTSVTPPRTLVWHWCRALLSDSQLINVSLVMVVVLERFSDTRKSARQPRSTQITLLRKPQVCPCTQLESFSVRESMTLSSIPVRHSTYLPSDDSQRTVDCATADAATSRTATAMNVVLFIGLCPPKMMGGHNARQGRRAQEALSDLATSPIPPANNTSITIVLNRLVGWK